MAPRNEHEHARRLRLYQNGLADAEIASKLSVDKTAISSWRIRAGLPAHGKNRLDADEEKRRRRELAKGGSDREIAERLGIGHWAFAQWRQRRGLSPG